MVVGLVVDAERERRVAVGQRRDAMTPSARRAANACRMVPRDTEYRSASSCSEGSRVPAA
jgi:hypothetical protein